VALLEEFIDLRGKDDQYIVEQITQEFIDKYDREFIERFVYKPEEIPKKQKNKFLNELSIIGYDIEYRKYLSKYNSDFDEFCVVVDRDSHAHIEECLKHCKDKKYNIYITNPCFEFWLLLHIIDVSQNYDYNDLLNNGKNLISIHS
jgi:hypothetical protein